MSARAVRALSALLLGLVLAGAGCVDEGILGSRVRLACEAGVRCPCVDDDDDIDEPFDDDGDDDCDLDEGDGSAPDDDDS